MFTIIGAGLVGLLALGAMSKKKKREAAGAGANGATGGLPLDVPEADPADVGRESGEAAAAAAAAAEAAARAAERAATDAERVAAAESARAEAERALKAAEQAAEYDRATATAALEAAKRAEAAAKKAEVAAGKDDDDDDEDEEPILVSKPGKPAVPVPPKEVESDDDEITTAEEDELEKDLEPDEAPAVDATDAPEAALPAAETTPAEDPTGSIKLARLLLEREMTPGWRGAMSTAVTTWQQKNKLATDGKFGPKSAYLLADKGGVGIVPLVRYWPKGSQKAAALAKYRAELLGLADKLEANPDRQAQADALRGSATVEDARAYGTANPPALPAAERARLADS
jgi:hypothetical protein